MIAGSLSMMMCRLLPRLSLRKKLETGNSTLHSILEYCEQNAAGPMELETVAEALHLSRFYVFPAAEPGSCAWASANMWGCCG